MTYFYYIFYIFNAGIKNLGHSSLKQLRIGFIDESFLCLVIYCNQNHHFLYKQELCLIIYFVIKFSFSKKLNRKMVAGLL